MWNALQDRDFAEALGRHQRWLRPGMLVLAFSGTFFIGFLFGWFIKSSNEVTSSASYPGMKKAFLHELKAENIKNFLYNFTQTPHLAGTQNNFELAKQIHDQWKEFGLDMVELSHYDVLLSYPNKTHPNYISIISEDGNEIFKTSLSELSPPGYENITDVVPPYNAFSAQGTPEEHSRLLQEHAAKPG
ncbi:Folh1 protein [Apodemus speciosus]|uniref:Folh1 protein n=1 Tax=Apodemus speciosus TaxID=105296 RepID=A0ABQ0EZ44_APOSI